MVAFHDSEMVYKLSFRERDSIGNLQNRQSHFKRYDPQEQNQYLDHEGISIIVINDNNIIDKKCMIIRKKSV